MLFRLKPVSECGGGKARSPSAVLGCHYGIGADRGAAVGVDDGEAVWFRATRVGEVGEHGEVGEQTQHFFCNIFSKRQNSPTNCSCAFSNRPFIMLRGV
jgi:hypothetical protein